LDSYLRWIDLLKVLDDSDDAIRDLTFVEEGSLDLIGETAPRDDESGGNR
jgi:hypothetical protein